jgi:spore coat polysaccharide biosynthesis predicted glycosyltransferase SpsG
MRILLHCNGGGSLGVGHVMRSLALAEAGVAAGHDVVVAGRFEGTFLQGQLAAAPVEVIPMTTQAEYEPDDPDELVELVRRLRPDVLHVDSYQASGRLRDLAASAGVEAGVPATVLGGTVLSNIEDGTFGRRPADVVVDPTLGAERTPRPEDGSTWLLRGSRFSPLRRRVIDAIHGTPESTGTTGTTDTAGTGGTAGTADATYAKDPAGAGVESTVDARSVLVVMGGTDPSGMAPVAVELLARTGLSLEVTVITAGQNAQRARAAAKGSALALHVVTPVDDLPSLMADQDLVISAAGTSVWELLCLGVPAVVAWTVDNQREGYERVVAAGAAIGLGGPGLGGDGEGDSQAVHLLRDVLTDGRARADLVKAGHQLVDGLGAWRVVRTWEMAVRADVRRSRENLTEGGDALSARPATLNDSRLLWLWRNDPLTRAGSRSTAEVPWDEHLRWLAASLAQPGRKLYLVSDAAGPVGTVRWDRVGTHELAVMPSAGEAEEWEVSVTVAPQRRGQSLARPLLRAGERALSGATSALAFTTPAGDASAVASDGTRAGGTEVTAYLAVVQVDNLASIRLFETSGYLPDLPPDPRGFMRYRKIARVT